MTDQPKPFWMVKGAGPASAIHHSRGAAEAEAQRLARLHPGNEFFVMEAVAVHRKVDVERIVLRHDADYEELPF